MSAMLLAAILTVNQLPPKWATVYSSRDFGESPRTACGGLVRDNTLHAAVRDAGCGDKFRVCSLQTGRCIEVVADDAGPWGLVPDPSVPRRRRDWRNVTWNRVHKVYTPTESLMNTCRAARSCVAPRGWLYKTDIDLSPRGFRELGHRTRQGRIPVTLERTLP